MGAGTPAAHGYLQSQANGAFSMDPQQWADDYILVNQSGDIGEYDGEQGNFTVWFEGDATVMVELQLYQAGGTVTDVEEEHVAPLLPGDSRFVDEFTDVLPGSNQYVTAVLFISDSLHQDTSSESGVILVTYSGSSPSSIDYISLSIGS